MKRNSSQNKGKVFPFHHNTASILACVLALLLCAAGIGMSVYRIIAEGLGDLNKILQSPFLILVCLFCAAIIISILVKSEFIVVNGELITSFGFIKSRLTIATITKMGKDGVSVNTDVLVKICQALNVNIGDIMDLLPEEVQ